MLRGVLFLMPRSTAATRYLVGVPGGYRLMLRAAARDEGGTMLAPSDLPATMNALMQGRGHGQALLLSSGQAHAALADHGVKAGAEQLNHRQ